MALNRRTAEKDRLLPLSSKKAGIFYLETL